MPDIDDLSNFSEGMHVNSLPASEVRRRGDRMRRRNTALATVGGVVAAAVFIGTPVALLSGNNDRDDVDPAPQPTPTVTENAPPTWLTEIPADFPVTEGMVTGDGELAEGGTDAYNLCDTPYPTSRGTEVTQTWSYSDDGESYVRRTFQLWPDDSTAEESLTSLIEAIEACPQQPTAGGEDIIKTQHVPFDLGGDDSVTFVQQIAADDGLISQLTTVEVTRVGNAVLVSSSYGSAGGDEAIGIATQILADRSATTRAAMCVFSADPCSISTGEGEDPAPPAPSSDSGTNPAIPADFPLDSDFDADVDGDKVGPAADTEGVLLTDLCATTAWPPANGAGRLAVRVTGPEYLGVRELVTFASTSDAVAAVAAVRAALASCPEAPADEPANDRVFTELEADTGYQDAVTFGQTYREGTGGGVYQFVRVGNAVLATLAAGEYLPTSLQGGADALTEDNLVVTDAMCLWTEAGCA